MNLPPRKLIFFTFLIILFSEPTSSSNLTLNFPSFTLRNFTLLGDSYLRDGAVGLTRELGVPSSSAGAIICNLPVQFFDRVTNISASFATRFTFTITNTNPDLFGDGLTFFISPNNSTHGSAGAYLGLVNSSNPDKNKFFAVEFDTRLDTQFEDPNSNHIGLDVDDLTSVKTVDVSLHGINLKSGNLITAWVEYEDDKKKVTVWLSYSNLKPEKSILSMKVDLSKHFEDFMYLGFSASTEGSTELHVIDEWSFETYGFHSLNLPYEPLYKPHNVSDTTWTLIPVIPVTKSRSNSHKKLKLGLGIGGPIVVCAVLVAFSWCSIKKWREIQMNTTFKPEIIKGPRKFSYRELYFATNGFHSDRIVGCGAFGTVYKAVFGSGLTCAVKRSKQAHQGQSEFLAELSIIGCLRHKNLVQLQGWCTEKSELLLVYEFMPNGSLDKILYEEPREGLTLKWDQRYNVAVGIASVLTYLHQECEQQVIHRDIKTSNIMLDAHFNPRLGDFGLARLTEHNKSPVSTLTAGTMGYLAPEYLQYGKATEKTDTFSFGIVVLEIACGKRPIDKDVATQKSVNLVDWVWGLYSKDKLIEAADPRLNEEFDKEEMKRLLLVGLSCVNPDYTQRPSMRRVLQILNDEAEGFVVPRTKPSLTFSRSLPLNIHEIISDSEESVIMSPLYELRID